MSKLSLIIKSICWVVLLTVTILGAVAHFDSETKKSFFDAAGFKDQCKKLTDNTNLNCPHNAMDLERVFLSFTIICLILSAVSLIAEIAMKNSKLKMIDAGYQGLAGLLLIIAGACMLAAAIRADKFVGDFIATPVPGLPIGLPWTLSEARGHMKYSHKLAAGALAIVDSLLCFATAAIVAKG